MTKRPFPFESSIGRQRKTHVNDYENDITALREVRERTLRKLFDGPRRLHSIVLNNGESLHLVGNESQSKNGFMQKLLTNYITVNGRKLNDSGRIALRAADSPPSCFFCEATTNSTHQCIQCLEYYCSNCSFVNYEALEDRRICLSCS